jgi:hypothetical protein
MNIENYYVYYGFFLGYLLILNKLLQFQRPIRDMKILKTRIIDKLGQGECSNVLPCECHGPIIKKYLQDAKESFL